MRNSLIFNTFTSTKRDRSGRTEKMIEDLPVLETHEGMDGNGRHQVQSRVAGRQSYHVCLHPMGQHDAMPGRRTPALGQQPGGKCYPAHHVGTQELSLLRQPRGGGQYVGGLFPAGNLQGTRRESQGLPE